MKYKSATIFYWSGTGNSFRVSRWFGEIADNRGLKTQLLSLDKTHTENLTHNGKEEKDSFTLIVFPTHGFTAPWHVCKTVWRLPNCKGKRAFSVATRAGLKFGSLYTPGISGSANFVIALLLLLKGYKVCGTMSVDMPSNWFAFHPIQSVKSQEAIIGRAKEKVTGFMDKILTHSTIWYTVNNLYEIICGTLLSLISIAYLLMGRFFLAKLFFANNNCDGCRICEKNCSVSAIVIRGRQKKLPFWKYNCESCMKCASICPKNAIEAGHSWGIILYFVTAVPISVYLFSWLGLTSGNSNSLGKLIDIIYFYPAIFVSYAVFHALIRIPFVNFIFTRTTLTRLPFWGRYKEPDTKLRDLF